MKRIALALALAALAGPVAAADKTYQGTGPDGTVRILVPMLAHVNDAGFWLVKEYFGMTVGQTIKTWSTMETILSVTGLILAILAGLVVG